MASSLTASSRKRWRRRRVRSVFVIAQSPIGGLGNFVSPSGVSSSRAETTLQRVA
jgi:hypothetical protein